MKLLAMSGFPSKQTRTLRTARRRRLAFTLVELLVSMSILLVLMALVSQFMGMTFRSVSEARKRFEIQGKARSALELIARDLHSGIFQKKLTSFTDDTGNVALAFYTSHSGLIDAGDDPALYRPLSYVVYRTETSLTGGLPTLYRGGVSLQWELSATYPALPPNGNSLPFHVSNGVSELYLAATATGGSDTYQKLVEGVLRMEIGFLYDDGVVRSTFNIDPGTSTPPDPVAKAAIITILVASDSDTKKLAGGTTNPLVTYFNGASSPLPARSAVSSPSLLTEWEKALNNPTTWTAGSFPDGVSSSVRVYERIVYLP